MGYGVVFGLDKNGGQKMHTEKNGIVRVISPLVGCVGPVLKRGTISLKADFL